MNIEWSMDKYERRLAIIITVIMFFIIIAMFDEIGRCSDYEPVIDEIVSMRSDE